MTTERAVLAGGCFWGMQDLIRKLPGVEKTRVGYTGGDVPNATYRNHGMHAEGIEIVYDPSEIGYRDLLEFFFQIHDPTTRNRQGNDMGPSYRSAHLLRRRRAEKGGRRDHRRCRCFRSVARQGGDGTGTCRRFLGSGAGTSGLPGAHPQRLYLPFHPAELEAAAGARRLNRGRIRDAAFRTTRKPRNVMRPPWSRPAHQQVPLGIFCRE